MKKILLIAFLTLTSMSIQAQKELTWHTDMSKATDISKAIRVWNDENAKTSAKVHAVAKVILN